MKKRIKVFAAIFCLFIIVCLIGLFSSYRIKYVTEEILTTEEIKFAHITDTHLKNNYNEKKFEDIASTINESDSDVLMFTGDLFEIDEIDSELEQKVTDLFSSMEACHKLAVLGNHDYYDTVKRNTTIRILENSGFTVLINEDIVLEINGTDYHFVGLDDLRMGNTNYTDILETTNDYEYNYVLSHEPDTFSTVKMYDCLAQFSGHSHGGQVRLPLIGHIVMVGGAREYPEHYYYENNTELFTSFGCGETILPLRFFNPRYVNFYTNS